MFNHEGEGVDVDPSQDIDSEGVDGTGGGRGTSGNGCTTLSHTFNAPAVTALSVSLQNQDPRLNSSVPTHVLSSSSASTLPGPCRESKRRKAKFTQSDRIEYLRTDPYVAEFGAKKVLCASCDKWIELRPNLAYCSKLWDAHRKNCRKKVKYTPKYRNKIFVSDPDVKKFEAERLLCNLCSQWLPLHLTDHYAAVQMWLLHKMECAVTKLTDLNVCRPGSSSTCSSAPPPTTLAPQSTTSRSTRTAPPHNPNRQDRIHPASVVAQHQPLSQRRNAELRASILRADSLIEVVEPHRVFCSCCKKWVNLRWDSNYDLTRWMEHRRRCLAGQQKRLQKETEIVAEKAKNVDAHPISYPTHHLNLDDNRSPWPAPCYTAPNHHNRTLLSSGDYHDHLHIRGQNSTASVIDARPDAEEEEVGHVEQERRPKGKEVTNTKGNVEGSRDERYYSHSLDWYDVHESAPSSSHSARSYPQEQNKEYSSRDMYEHEHSTRYPIHPNLSPLPPPLLTRFVNLDTPTDRQNFVNASIMYLLSTTYETSDELRVSALVGFLNAAMPTNKYKRFDIREVVEVLSRSGEGENFKDKRRRVILKGDLVMLR